MSPRESLAEPWSGVRERFRRRGLRWTPQRRTVVEVLADTDGHVTGAELIERCRARDPQTIPSTVYRTLDVLEELGLVRHGHGADGREEFHVSPGVEHGHLYCAECGSSWEIRASQAGPIVDAFRRADGFEVDLSHVTVVGRCATCAATATT
jgi:Fur family ferric uptake transcriptional regulator